MQFCIAEPHVTSPERFVQHTSVTKCADIDIDDGGRPLSTSEHLAARGRTKPPRPGPGGHHLLKWIHHKIPFLGSTGLSAGWRETQASTERCRLMRTYWTLASLASLPGSVTRPRCRRSRRRPSPPAPPSLSTDRHLTRTPSSR